MLKFISTFNVFMDINDNWIIILTNKERTGIHYRIQRILFSRSNNYFILFYFKDCY